MNDDHEVTPFPASARIRELAATTVASGKVGESELEVVITHLQMRQPPVPSGRSHRGEKLALMHVENSTASFYRYLYDAVGKPWLWYERRRMDDATLLPHIHDTRVHIYVLFVAGVPAGFFELDAREANDVELKYFGLVPEFIGRGLGAYLLEKALETAWAQEPERVWLKTCSLDHPKAIAVYQRAGFVPYAQETVLVGDPRLDGTMD